MTKSRRSPETGGRGLDIGENGVAWHTGLLGKPHISDSWQPLGNIDYHGMIHHHQEVLEKKYKIPVPVSILVP